MKDFSFGITSKDGTSVVLDNRVSGSKFETDQVAIINGRLVRDGSEILARSKKGCFYNPVLYAENGEYQLLSESGDLYSANGKERIFIPSRPSTMAVDSKKIVLPTLVSNAFESGPRYLKFICYGEDAMKIASATKGSSLTLIGGFETFTTEAISFRYLVVKELILRPKGAVYDGR